MWFLASRTTEFPPNFLCLSSQGLGDPFPQLPSHRFDSPDGRSGDRLNHRGNRHPHVEFKMLSQSNQTSFLIFLLDWPAFVCQLSVEGATPSSFAVGPSYRDPTVHESWSPTSPLWAGHSLGDSLLLITKRP